MAILSVFETPDGRSSSMNDKREREYVRTFKVVTSYATDGPEMARLADGIPRLWNPYVSASGLVDLGSWCRQVDARPTADPYTWAVEARYSSRVERPDLNLIENPLLRPADVEWDTVERLIPVYRDRYETDVKTSSNELFDPPIEQPIYDQTLTISRNQSTYNAILAVSFHNTVNSGSWWGFQPGQVKCCKIKGSRQFENGLLFWRVVYEFHIRPVPETLEGINHEAWSTVVIDRGFMVLDGAGKQKVALDVFGRPVTSPVLLDGAGAKLTPGSSPVYHVFNFPKERNFAELNLV